MESKTRILFVCLGNICRSPAADGIMHDMVEKQGVADRFTIDSAGTYGGHRGELPRLVGMTDLNGHCIVVA